MYKFLMSLLFVLGISFVPSMAFADGTPPPTPPVNTPPAETDAQRLAAALRREEEYKAEIEKLKKDGGKVKASGDDDDDLVAKARRDAEEKEGKASETREIERALRFNLTIDDFVKTNKDFLPEEVSGILVQASKERYDNSKEQASALKSALISSYFAVQANIDSLTPAHRKQVEDWKGLTKRDREKRAADLYENVFEPTIETARRIKKAEEVAISRRGFAKPTEAGEKYKDKLIKAAQAAHLGKKD